MPADLWEGTIETSPAPFTVLPLEQARIDQLIAEIDGPGPAVEAAAFSPLAGAGGKATLDAWLRRFIRARDGRATVVSTIVAIGDRDGITHLLDLAMGLPDNERQALIMQSGPKPGFEAPDCTGVPWLLEWAGATNSQAIDSVQQAARAAATRCPSLLTGLRASVQGPMARASMLELLGRVGDRRDLPLLLSIATTPRPDAVQGYARRDFEAVRGGALRGLASLGGEEAAEAILERLRATASDTFATRDAVDLAGRLPLPEATPALIDLLPTKDPALSHAAMRALEQRGGRTVVPVLEAQLADPQPVIRQNAAGFVRRSGAAVSLPLMREVARDGDPWVRSTALFQLAARGDSSDVPLFVGNVTTRIAQEPAIQGIERHGTAETFAQLRTMLDGASQESRRWVTSALQRLTFAPIWQSASEWDMWWASHSRSTRADWAREALASSDTTSFSTNALLYLAKTGQLSPQTLEGAVAGRGFNMRLTAAQIIGESDPRRGVLLMVREFENRSIYACQRAMKELNTLAVSSDQLDCTSLVERESARKRWTARAETLRP